MRTAKSRGVAWGIIVAAATCVSAEPPKREVESGAALAESTGTQQLLELPVRVVDGDGKPVGRVKITPWALRSSQGHGWWRKGDERSNADPNAVVTNAEGVAVVLYPYYRDVEERIRTSQVSLEVDHPEFAYDSDLHIDVPLEKNEPYQIKLNNGIPLEVRPLIDGKTPDLDQIFVDWSDGRSWKPGAAPERQPAGILRIPHCARAKTASWW